MPFATVHIAKNKQWYLDHAASIQRKADSYRKRGWEKAAAEWDAMAEKVRRQAEEALE